MRGMWFQPENIKAIVEGRKTVTRRLSGLKEINKEPDKWVYHQECSLPKLGRFTFFYDNQKTYNRETATMVIKPRYQVGETVYIKEAWCESYYGKPICYKLDGGESPGPKGFWRSPMFLSAENARYFIKITDVRAERLQKITQEDAIAEGIKPPEHAFVMVGSDIDAAISPKEEYAELWDSINPKYPFESSPWIWRYEFKC